MKSKVLDWLTNQPEYIKHPITNENSIFFNVPLSKYVELIERYILEDHRLIKPKERIKKLMTKKELKNYIATQLAFYAYSGATTEDTIERLYNLALIYSNNADKKDCVHPFKKVISIGNEHNCTLCGNNI